MAVDRRIVKHGYLFHISLFQTSFLLYPSLFTRPVPGHDFSALLSLPCFFCLLLQKYWKALIQRIIHGFLPISYFLCPKFSDRTYSESVFLMS